MRYTLWDLRLCTYICLAVVAGALWGPAAEAEEKVDFSRHVRPILARNCFACHGPDSETRQAGLRLDVREAALGRLESGATAIVPGDLAKSELVVRITSSDPNARMPPPGAGHDLSPEQIETLKRWVQQGAEFSPHWSLVPPRRPPLPAASDREWVQNPIDAFTLERLEQAGLAPNPLADKHAIIRRLSLDLRGLPPTPWEVAEFVNDQRPTAYATLVDRYLADSAFGERWARMWLDLARYADSRGYGSDPLRPNAWRFRDWVIDAFNSNQPYDQFTIEQMAGDLLPNATLEQRMATAFHRNTMTNTEGGTDDEEFRVAAVKDRVDTTLQVWMGLTMGCAKCHNHKYDPITNQEYYQFYAFFNQTADADRNDDAPFIEAPTPGVLRARAAIDEKIANLRKQLDTPPAELTAEQKAWEESVKLTAPWEVLTVVSARSEGGAELRTLEDGSILAAGQNPANDVYVVTACTNKRPVTAFRLEVLPDASLPGGGAGRAADGNFVLSQLRVTAGPAPQDTKNDQADPTPRGRFVRVELPGKGKFLHLAEVQVYSGGKNVALSGKASQSSTDYDGPPERAIDNNTNGNYYEGKSTSHTRGEDNPWWEVDLGGEYPIDRVVIWNRTDGGTQARITGYRLLLLDANRKTVWQQAPGGVPDPKVELSPSSRIMVALAQPVADHAQPGFPVEAAIDPRTGNQSGWAVGPQSKEPHAAIFLAASPVAGFERTEFTFRLEHRYKDSGYNVGRFRISISSDANAGKRLPVPAEILAIVDTEQSQRTPEQSAKLAAHYRSIAPSLQGLRDQIAVLEKSKPAIPTLPVMQELPADQRRTTRVLIKGNFLNHGELVEPGTPASLHPMAEYLPRNRLGMAHWLVDRQNPLTARVAVNRFWAQLFGTGLVETEEDFGMQGELPSHPELLDWLAVEFMESGWDMKSLLRMMVTSATYRQSQRVDRDRLVKDPRNRLLSRGPRFRLEAEMVRDQALSLAGLLSRKLGGPSVYPPQPEGLWQAAFNGERTWPTSSGEDRYRRGLYTFWRRTIPYPSMATFDAPSREICALRRTRTNTPLQAFVTMNDPVFVEASQALARRIVAEGGSENATRAKYGLELCLARPATEKEVAQVLALYESEAAYYAQHLPAATKLATEPLGPLPEGKSAAEMAAWTVVANVLLNLDGVLAK